MGERRNYYRILGVQPDATRDVIRGAYRTLLQKLQIHPDLGGDDRTAALVNAAWHTLRNPARRAAYDRTLLAEYDIRMIASGGEPRPSAATAGERRNYYRVLGVQPDAPGQLIHSAYRVMAGVRGDDALVTEAYRVLSDPRRREEYDALLAAGEPGPDDAEYQPLIGAFCFFCKTPHDQYPGAAEQQRCAECASPLRPPGQGATTAERGYHRAGVDVAATLFDYWPGPGWTAELEELTPQGLRVRTECRLERHQVVRVQASGMDVVARVVHTRSDGSGYRAGMMLLAAAFDAAGLLVDLQT